MISTIQTDMIIDGDITETNDLIVHGQINGNVKVKSLKIETEGTVCGNITCKYVVSSGDIIGKIDALNVSLLIGSDTKSEVTATTLQVEISAMLDGKCNVGLKSIVGEPTKSILTDPSSVSSTISATPVNPKV